jgi:hypothetical protein
MLKVYNQEKNSKKGGVVIVKFHNKKVAFIAGYDTGIDTFDLCFHVCTFALRAFEHLREQPAPTSGPGRRSKSYKRIWT